MRGPPDNGPLPGFSLLQSFFPMPSMCSMLPLKALSEYIRLVRVEGWENPLMIPGTRESLLN